MKKFALFFALALLTFTACNKDEEEMQDVVPSDPFLGAWIITEATGEFAEDNMGTTYNFTEAGEVTVEKGLLFNEGTYTRNDSMILMVLSGIEVNYFYTLSDGQMQWEHQSANQNFVLERP